MVTLTVDGSTKPPRVALYTTFIFTSNILLTATMTDLTPALNELLSSKNNPPLPSKTSRPAPTETTDEFLKEAYRIVSPNQTSPKPTMLTPKKPELPHPLPSKIPPHNPPSLPHNNSRAATQTPQQNNHHTHPTQPPTNPPNNPHGSRPRRNRHLNSPPPPRPHNLNNKPRHSRIPPPRNPIHAPPQEIRPQRRRRSPPALGGRRHR